MTRRDPRGGSVVLLAGLLCLAGCPRRATTTVAPPPEELPPRAEAVLRSFADLTPSTYAALTGGPPTGLAVHKLARAHDADLFGLSVAEWGPPTRRVLQIEDQDHPNTGEGAVAAWVLEPGKEPAATGPLDPDALLYGPISKRVVRSVLLRDWVDAPKNADPFDLLLALAPQLPAPLTVCRPRTAGERALEAESDDKQPALPHTLDPVRLEAIAPERGVRVALRPVVPAGAVAVSGHGPFTWTVDHIEWSAPGRSVDSWWESLGFEDCVDVGKILSDTRVKHPKRPFGPADAAPSDAP